jgi:hypothetical protein
VVKEQRDLALASDARVASPLPKRENHRNHHSKTSAVPQSIFAQDSFPSFRDSEREISPRIRLELARLAQSKIEERGAIFTRSEVVEFILNLIGYSEDKPLYQMKILEPSFGEGGFLLSMVRRLLTSYKKRACENRAAFSELQQALRAVELHDASFQATRNKLAAILGEFGFENSEVEILIESWLVPGDFLLEPIDFKFNFVVGNPPYLRQELIPDVLLEEYRRRYTTVYDRADIYIPFIERSLSLLAPNGSLGFICADRWMKNRYGGPLRRMVAQGYRLKYYVDMVNTNAFDSDVLAYPAITVITREQGGPTRLAHRPAIEHSMLSELAQKMTGSTRDNGTLVKEIEGVVFDDAPWILESSDQTAIVRRLEENFPELEETGCKIGIGVATGADKVFIGPLDDLNVEEDRKLPLVMTRDIKSGVIQWSGHGVINPFSVGGGLVRLSDYPKLAAYLEKHGAAIKARHVSKRNPIDWYRTIDRITPELASTPKLLIPDIKGNAHIVYEDGKLYPHHNLYFITSKEWDLKALCAVLMSGIARLFVATYSTRMHGGYLRFQAQYLRRIRLPRWGDVPAELRHALIEAAENVNVGACNAAAFEVYGLSKAERAALGGNGD